ncbi:hypothetical protein [Antiquaquibacter soli]|uniref:Uncharacterized protein n=1 Tax=Antiquaquibacter soli TaxID=3064523 RepID=A0ABT9BQX6_9MICO|nr:hypothetical protein [Protaetiibacter sp. WY-16]MDO7883431.1 hypothetical protein [Protaetiibacter sp. WY-16]
MPSQDLRAALDRDLLFGLVQQAIARPDRIPASRHENGFEKLTLGVDPATGALIRAHFWSRVDSESDAATVGNLHNHRWDFASLVLRGELRIATYVESSAGEDYYYYRYWPERGDELEFIGVTRLARYAIVSLGAGSEYDEPAEEIHHASPRAGVDTVTVMARSPGQKTFADVYSLRARPDVVESSSDLPMSRVAELLDDLAGLVEAARLRRR